jgi:hypothetical protein
MIYLIKMFLAHFLADFLFQPNRWVEDKVKNKLRSIKLYVHVLIHAVVTLILLGSLDYWPMTIVLMFSHLLFDSIKLVFQKEKTKTAWFIIDQVLHLLSIILIWWIYFVPTLSIDLRQEQVNTFWMYATAIVFATYVSGFIIQELLYKWSKAVRNSDIESLTNAGKYIGMLERMFVFVFVVTSHWEGIGFLLAAKSIFRFGDLKESKDRVLTEYILIGTLLSFGIAFLTGLAVLSFEKYLTSF